MNEHFIRVGVTVWVEWGEGVTDPEVLEIFRRVATMPPNELYMTATTQLWEQNVDDAIEASGSLWVERGYYVDVAGGPSRFVTRRAKLWVEPDGSVTEYDA